MIEGASICVDAASSYEPFGTYDGSSLDIDLNVSSSFSRGVIFDVLLIYLF